MLHVEVRDDAEGLWQLATQNAEFSPNAPDELIGKTLEEAKIDPIAVQLRCRLFDGSHLVVVPAADEEYDYGCAAKFLPDPEAAVAFSFNCTLNVCSTLSLSLLRPLGDACLLSPPLAMRSPSRSIRPEVPEARPPAFRARAV